MKKYFTIPYAPCMEYLPTFTPKNQPNVGKYAIHGASGHNFLFSAMIFQVTPMVAMVHGSKGDEHQCYVNENTGDAKPVGSPVVM